ncbi:MAG: PSD1 and planctomycete cytochrome C domain-containing protein [Planctomycetota bacterium]|nr:PSD1 and planctomycete cytochrome C domain-containing protein [Planctomycetota bacterium]
MSVAAVALVTCLVAQPSSGDRAGIDFFESRIRPLLAENCYECHSRQAKKLRGGLRLDSREGLRRGGDSGPAIVPGKPAASLLVRAVRRVDPDLRMPPRKELSRGEVDAIVEWVRRGAPDPRTGDERPPERAPASDLWSLRRPVEPALPPVRDASWPATPVDRFILSGLERRGLEPAPAADRRTLIRRLSFDLLGLPPGPWEIEEFLEDDSPDAWARLVDRWLATPRYGERWGRHWLDVARYADSNGLDENVAHGNAWRYRDYVVASFNRDRPFDRFVLEQLAGDLLPAPPTREARNERLVATGFLSLGPKVLAEGDVKKMEMDIIDEQVDTLGRSFLGLSLGCARCHDHKFDPVSTEDYHALAGILKSTRTMESFKRIARWHENSLASPEEVERKKRHDEEVERLKETLKALKENAKKPAARGGGASEAPAGEVGRLEAELKRLEAAAPVLPSAMGVAEGEPTDLRVHIRGSHLTLGAVVPRGFPAALSRETAADIGAGESGRLQLARWIADGDHPLTARVMGNRIWRWHFGEGIVRTPDNFGNSGERPTHPELLDWLALRFVESGWSVKAMHRLILLSRTYRMSSLASQRAEKLDPTNRLHSHAPLRRLEAEALRDALLAVSGTLDLRKGGPALHHVKNRAFLFDHTSRDRTRYDSTRRSVYLPVIRNHVYDVFQLFDFPDPQVPSGDRSESTIAPQALFFLNSELLERLSRELASRLLAGSDEDIERLERLYVRALGRPPSGAETSDDLAFIDRFAMAREVSGARSAAAHEEAWAALCQTLLASNEFLYVR